MNLAAKLALGLLLGTGVRETVQQHLEHNERAQVFKQAREYADSSGKPLLVVGVPKSAFPWHPCGDVNIDIDPNVSTNCEYEIADIRAIPYPARYFGAAYASHVLEHLPSIDDAKQALNELHRVADKVFIVSPHKSSILAWLHPGHHLWITAAGDGFLIEQRGYKRPATTDESYVGMVSMKDPLCLHCQRLIAFSGERSWQKVG